MKFDISIQSQIYTFLCNIENSLHISHVLRTKKERHTKENLQSYKMVTHNVL